MRLIDAEAFKTQVSAMAIKYNLDTNKAILFLKIIDSQPTAYNVDKIVERLEEYASYLDDDNDADAVAEALINIVKGAV